MTSLVRPYKFVLLILLVAIAARALLLEYSDLIDPTETRYASVAQEMYLSGDWLTPKLPIANEIVPYLGKPPLHFWLTAASYSIFGMDEWSSRLPSFIAAILMIGAVYFFCNRYFGAMQAVSASLIGFSAGVFFFLSGASVVDVTFASLVTCSAFLFYVAAIESRNQRAYVIAASAFAALSVLAKGPLGPVLIFFPFFLWSLVRRDFTWIRRVPWLTAFIVGIAITAPWFLLTEYYNPGFIKYFIWNENIARYLFKDYGDRYGYGHVHTRGMAWIMLIAAFMPWTVLMAWGVLKSGVKNSLNLIRENPELLFALMLGLSPAIFFTFVRQLHMMYLLPGVPGLAIVTAFLMDVPAREGSKLEINLNRYVPHLTALTSLILIIVGAALDFSSIGLGIALITAVIGLYALSKDSAFLPEIRGIISMFIFFVTSYVVAIGTLSPYLDSRRSSEDILHEVIKRDTNSSLPPRIGIIALNTYSHFWTANAWKTELSEPVEIIYIDPAKLETDVKKNRVKYLIAKHNSAEISSQINRANFSFVTKQGAWSLYSNNLESDRSDGTAAHS